MVSAEASLTNTIEKGNLNLKASVGASALDLEVNSGDIGWDNLYGNVGAEGEILTAKCNRSFKIWQERLWCIR